MKKNVLLILVLILVLSACQTFWDDNANDIHWSNLPDPESVKEIKQFTLDLIKLKAEIKAAEKEQDFVRKMQLLDKLVTLVQDYVGVSEEEMQTIEP